MLCALNAISQTWHSLNIPNKTYGLFLGSDTGGIYAQARIQYPYANVFYLKNSKWDSMPGKFYGNMNSTVEYNNSRVFVGAYAEIGGKPYTVDVVSWDGNTWSAFGTGGELVDVYCAAEYKGDLYIGGKFLKMGGVNVKRMARWDGTKWDDVAGGVNGLDVEAMAVYHDKLYVGGYFGSAGGILTSCIARWDGVKWDSVGGYGVSSIVQCMYVDSVTDALYVGGGYQCK